VIKIGVSEEDIEQEELRQAIKQLVKCPFVDECLVPITEEEFKEFCLKDYKQCSMYQEFVEKKIPKEWARKYVLNRK